MSGQSGNFKRVNLKGLAKLAAGVVFFAALASAGTVNYACDPSIDATVAGTCSYLNSVVAGAYDSTFTNADASIYITYGSTGLASTAAYLNAVPYADYAAALAANPNQNALQASAVASLANDISAYGSGNVGVTVALANALGISGDAIGGLTGIAANDDACAVGSLGCYNAVVTLSDAANTWYYSQVGGSANGLYDIYSAIEHETDEVLGTSSCVGTGGATLSDGCDFFGGSGTPSAVDLFRYNALASLAVNNAYLGLASAPSGAYFSYDGGATNGANGFAYNTVSNGADYADLINNCPAGPFSIQDAYGCPVQASAGQTILNDGGAEINILNAVGYNLAPSGAPEPGTVFLLGAGLAALGVYRRRRA